MAAEIERLAAEDLQSDERFARLLVEQRVGRGDGPLKLRGTLAERGIDDALVERVLAPYADDWAALAATALTRRFGAGAGGRAQRARFLQRRGFPDSIVRRVVDADRADGRQRTEPER